MTIRSGITQRIGRPPAAIVGVAVLAALLFALLSVAVFTDTVVAAWDQRLQKLLLLLEPGSAWYAAMVWVSDLHRTGVVLMGLALMAGWFHFRRDGFWLRAVWCGPLAMITNWLLKEGFVRARPLARIEVASLESFSFPSGHTLAATMFYGLLVCAVRSRGTPHAKGIEVAGMLAIALVGYSRVALGAHYPSDVLAAMLEGMFWLAMIMAVRCAIRSG